MYLPTLPKDKADHLTYGLVISLVAFVILNCAGVQALLAANLAQALVVAFGIGKEVMDGAMNYRSSGDWRVGPHGVAALDVVATAAGGAPLWIAVRLTAMGTP